MLETYILSWYHDKWDSRYIVPVTTYSKKKMVLSEQILKSTFWTFEH